ncbi:helix-turn-helix transcriptional regulator [Streptomyces noursei]|uniref:helix-turn-helix domain-containing protein n=1 Tax=Streptomyces noursei TaxID=1971 RepID=UPI0033F7A693
MSTSPSSAVQEAREALGQRLKEIRQPTGMTARAFAARAGWHEAKASRIENGKTVPSDADLRTYADLCGVPEVYPDLLATAHGIEGMYVEWRRLQREGMRHAQQAHVPLYERTEHFRIYDPSVIPGIVQTRDYARAIMGTISAFRRLPDDVDAAVDVRMQRQHVLQDAGRRFGIILEEAALRAQFGSPEAMAAQLGHLLNVASMQQVSLGIVPFAATRHMWPLEAFWIFDDDQVIIELATAQVTVKQPSEINTYARMFAKLVSIASYGKEARTLIAEAINALG